MKIATKTAGLFILLFFAGWPVCAQTQETVKFPAPAEEKLATAARYGDFETVEKLLAGGVSPNARDRFNQPAILLALRFGRYKTAEQIQRVLTLLTDAGADVNVSDQFGVSPFYLAKVRTFLHPDEKLAEFLVAKGAVPKEKDKYGRSPFSHFHRLQADEPPAEQLWREMIEGLTFRMSKSEVLTYAAGSRFLFNNATFPMGAVYYAEEVPLVACSAAKEPQTETDAAGETIYFYAARNYRSLFEFIGCFSESQLPESDAEKQTLVERLNEKFDWELFRRFHRDFIERRNKRGETPLDVALQYDARFFAALYYVIVNRPNEFLADGLTPLFQAIKHKNYLAVSYLRWFLDTDPNLKLKDGTTPLIYAVKTGDERTVHTLLRETPPETVAVPVKSAKPAIDLADADGKTPLMWAAEKGFSRIVKILLRNGADPGRKAKDGATALSLAKTNKHSSIIYRFSQIEK